MDQPPRPIDPIEAQRRAEATEQALDEMRAGDRRYAWWNHPWDELGGRTPTQALRDGDELAVRGIIDLAYQRSEEAAERLGQDPELVERIERKAAELYARRSA